MEITGLGAKEITIVKPRVQIPHCSSFTIMNYTNVQVFVNISDVLFPVPAIDSASGMPGIFTNDGDFTYSNIDLTVEFPDGGKTGKVLIAYKAKQTC